MATDTENAIEQLCDTLPQIGKVLWIGLRPQRQRPMKVVDVVEAAVDQGIIGDHYPSKPGGKRQVTLIQAEHIDTVAACLGQASIDPSLLRRNIVVHGINLLALKNKSFSIGTAILEMTGLCQPCSRMEQNLGAGGYNAMRGHGGITARVIRTGQIRVGDAVHVTKEQQ